MCRQLPVGQCFGSLLGPLGRKLREALQRKLLTKGSVCKKYSTVHRSTLFQLFWAGTLVSESQIAGVLGPLGTLSGVCMPTLLVDAHGCGIGRRICCSSCFWSLLVLLNSLSVCVCERACVSRSLGCCSRMPTQYYLLFCKAVNKLNIFRWYAWNSPSNALLDGL